MPVTPRAVGIPRDATVELQAAGAGMPRSPGFRLLLPRRAGGGDPRDLCVATVPVGVGLGEANVSCDVRAAGEAASFVQQPGLPDRLGPAPTVVAGIAPADIGKVELRGPGGRRTLLLSRNRACLALYAQSARGQVRLVARRAGGGTSVRTFALPLSRQANLFPRHPHRRRGAVFGDEVDKGIVGEWYEEIVSRFGPPAVLRREDGDALTTRSSARDGSEAVLLRRERPRERRERQCALAFAVTCGSQSRPVSAN